MRSLGAHTRTPHRAKRTMHYAHCIAPLAIDAPHHHHPPPIHRWRLTWELDTATAMPPYVTHQGRRRPGLGRRRRPLVPPRAPVLGPASVRRPVGLLQWTVAVAVAVAVAVEVEVAAGRGAGQAEVARVPRLTPPPPRTFQWPLLPQAPAVAVAVVVATVVVATATVAAVVP